MNNVATGNLAPEAAHIEAEIDEKDRGDVGLETEQEKDTAIPESEETTDSLFITSQIGRHWC